MNIADLSAVPDTLERFRIDTDFRNAMRARDNARRELHWKLPGWRWNHRFEMRAAIRAWRHYSNAVRSAVK